MAKLWHSHTMKYYNAMRLNKLQCGILQNVSKNLSTILTCLFLYRNERTKTLTLYETEKQTKITYIFIAKVMDYHEYLCFVTPNNFIRTADSKHNS